MKVADWAPAEKATAGTAVAGTKFRSIFSFSSLSSAVKRVRARLGMIVLSSCANPREALINAQARRLRLGKQALCTRSEKPTGYAGRRARFDFDM
jgi:hypothetical protein